MIPGTERILDYQLTCIGGLEDVCEDEVRAHLGSAATSIRGERGASARVFLRTEASPRRLLALRCPTAIHAIAAQAHDVTVGQPGLERIRRCARQVCIPALQRVARACAPQIDVTRARLRVSLQGAHRFAAADVEAGVAAILSAAGIEASSTADDGVVCLDLAVHVRKRRALITVRLGPRRPAGDPAREGWAGPAADSVARLLDLDPELQMGGVPAALGADSLWLRAGERQVCLRSRPERLPLAAASVPVLLQAAPTPEAEAWALAEAARVLAPGGITGLLVTRADAFAAHLRAVGLPFEVMAGLPFYARRRRCALFLLERLDLLGIESA